MSQSLRIYIFISMVLIILTGCGGQGSNTPPMLPVDSEIEDAVLSDRQNSEGSGNSHFCLTYNLIHIDAGDPNDVEFEIIPMREGLLHLNILKLLEVGPCTNCFRLVGWDIPSPGILDLDIEIRHPLPDLDFSCFDTRGIIMFDGSYVFPEAGLIISNPDIGEGALLNADGYTSLYNGGTLGVAPNDFFGYFEGNLATETVPNSQLNGFIRHNTPDIDNIRNYLEAGDSVTQTYSMQLPPTDLVVGYAVDCSWLEATEIPVDDIIADFPIGANCIEPWNLEVMSDPVYPLDAGAVLTINVYDWQGSSTHADPIVECPELFTGTATAAWVADGPGFTQYEVLVPNENGVASGEYTCLVSVEANENDPVAAPWFDLRAYQLHDITVNADFNLVEVTPDDLNFCSRTLHIRGYDAFVASSFNGLHIFDISLPAHPEWVSVVNTPGEARDVVALGNYAYVADYNRDLQVVDISPIETPLIVTELDLEGASFAIDGVGNYVYVTTATYPGCMLHIVDISTPDSPILENSIVTDGFPRDLQVVGGYAYLANGDGGLVVVDVDPPGTAAVVASVDTIGSAGDVAVGVTHAYVAADTAGVKIIDIDPPEASYVEHTVGTDDQAYGVTIVGDFLLVADEDGGIQFIDISAPALAAVIANLPVSFKMTSVRVMSDDYSLAGGISGGLIVIDTFNPLSPFIQETLYSPGSAYGVNSRNGYVYAGVSDAGMFSIDATVPEDAHITSNVDGMYSDNISIEGDYAYVADSSYGLMVVDISIPGSESLVDTVTPPGSCQDVVALSPYLYVAAGSSGLHILNNDPPGAPTLINTVPLPMEADFLAVEGDYAYVACTNYPDTAVEVVLIEPPAAAAHVHTVVLSGARATGIDASGNYAYIAQDGYGIEILDISDPTTAFITHPLEDSSPFKNLVYQSGYIFCTMYSDGLRIYDVDPVDTAYEVDTLDIEGYKWDVSLWENYAYVAAGPGGVRIVQLY